MFEKEDFNVRKDPEELYTDHYRAVPVGGKGSRMFFLRSFFTLDMKVAIWRFLSLFFAGGHGCQVLGGFFSLE